MVIRYFRSRTCFIQSDLVIKMGKCIFVLYLYCDAITLLCGLPKSLVKIFCNFLSIAKQLSGEGKKAPLCFTLLMAMSKKSKAFSSVWKIWIQLMKNVFFTSFIFFARVKYWYESAPFQQKLKPIWHEKWSLLMRSYFSIHHGSSITLNYLIIVHEKFLNLAF